MRARTAAVLAGALSLVWATASVCAEAPADEAGPERLRVRAVRSLPHDPEAFTQGLLWHEGHLYESTGQRGQSTVRRVDPPDGRVLASQRLDDHLFGEGLARVGDHLVQLTWQAGEAHVWRLPDLEHVRTHRYEGQGWGLCFDGGRLVMSDGSDRLVFRDPESFETTGEVQVREGDRPVHRLNELECVGDVVWANVWRTDRIVRIDPATGQVTGTVDASGLLDPAEARSAGVLNGIAWHPEHERLLLTGKRWPRLFEVALEPDRD